MGVRLTDWVTRSEKETGVLGLRSMALTDERGVVVSIVTEMHQETGRFYYSKCMVCDRSFANVNGRRGGFAYALGTYVEHYAERHQPPLAVIPTFPVGVFHG